jgi:hypothetical protein
MSDDRRRIDLTNQKFGLERRQEILDGISDKGTYLPKSVHYDDLDRSVLDFIENEVDLTIAGEKVPVLFMSIQRWSEFTKSWASSDNYKDLQLPFITVVRDPNVQTGTNQQKFWNIPGKPTYTYFKVPTLENGREGTDLYKIPQPTAVDLTFHVRFFSNRMTELNELHSIIHRKFNARQFYIYPQGHPMPLVLEGVNDDSKINDLETRKYYVQDYEIKLVGYILDEEDYQIVPTVDRANLHIGGGDAKLNTPKLKKVFDKNNATATYLITFNSNAVEYISVKMNEPTSFTSYTSYNIEESDTQFFVNGVLKTLPITLERNDEFKVKIMRTTTGMSTLTLSGDLL